MKCVHKWMVLDTRDNSVDLVINKSALKNWIKHCYGKDWNKHKKFFIIAKVVDMEEFNDNA